MMKRPIREWMAAGIAATLILVQSGCDAPLENISINKLTDEVFDLNCPGRTEHFDRVDTFLVIGHRGSPVNHVENTISSFEGALAEGANALEIDLAMTSDGEVVLWHDWDPNDAISLARESGGESGVSFRPRFPPIGSSLRKPIDEITLEQFRSNYWYTSKNILDKEPQPVEIPTFRQFVEWAAQHPEIRYVMLDMKIPESKAHLTETMVARMDSIIDAVKPAARFVYMSPHPSVWQVIATWLDGVGLSYDVDLGGGIAPGDPCAVSSSSYAQQRGGGFASTMHPFVWTQSPWTTLKQLLTCDLQRRDGTGENADPAVEKVIAATIDDEEKMQCLTDLGVDGLITNQPGRLRAVAQNAGKSF